MSGEQDASETNADMTSTQPEPQQDEHINASADKPGIAQQIRSTIDESKVWLESELAFQKIRLQDGGKRAKTIAILIGAGVILLICAFISLLLGIFITIAVYIGPVIALIMVPIGYALLGYIAFRIAANKIGGLKAMVRESGGITGLKTDATDAHPDADAQSDNESIAK